MLFSKKGNYFSISGILIVFTIFHQQGDAQGHQDCFSAIKVCTNTYAQTDASIGFGTIQDVAPQVTCLKNGESNSTWYIFKIKSGGTLSFQINPLNTTDDYDFVIYDLTNNSCSDIVNGMIMPLRCNFSSATGNTGLSQGASSTTSGAGESNQNSVIIAQAEQTFVLLVNNFTATNAGYELNFGGTTTIYDTEPPAIANTVIAPCSPGSADIFFTEDISCTSVAPDGSDFRIVGPSNVDIASAWSSGCIDNSVCTFIRLNFSSRISVPGTYKIYIRNGSDGNTISDFCDNMINVGAQIDFNVAYIGPVATIDSHTNTDCANIGSATASVTGGTPPYNYSWNTNPVQHNLTAQNLPVGVYTFVVTDANGCAVSAAVRIDSTGYPTLNSTVVATRCDSLNSGSATIYVTGGIEPYSYQWNTTPIQTSATANGLHPKTYTVVVTSATGCTASANVTIPITGLPVIDLSSTNVSCNGQVLGTATVTATGNNPFSYQWSTSVLDTLPHITGLSHGNYAVTVTDALGCQQTANVSIGAAGLQLNVSKGNLTCAAQHTGTATVNVSNGMAPYTFTWQTIPPQHDSIAINLDKGVYTVIVYDAGGCTATSSVEIDAPPAISISIASTDADCGLANGTATAFVAGGIAPYSYHWSTSPVQTSTTASNLAAGIYHFIATDSAGCTSTASAYVSNPNGPQGFIGNVANATCNENNGSAEVVNVTGSEPISYLWDTSPQQFQPTANRLAEGIYYVMIQDATHCVSFLHVKINSTKPAEISVSSITASSCGRSDGQAIVSGSGGAMPYHYQWLTNPVQNTANAQNLKSGEYISILTDGNGCKDSVIVYVPEKKAYNYLNVTPACSNSPVIFNGVSDYNQPVSWLWNFGDGNTAQGSSVFESTVEHIFSSTNDYTVTLIINGGCATDTIIKTIKGAYKPEASFTTKQNEFFATAPVQFIYTGSSVKLYEWNFDNQNFSYEKKPKYAFKNPDDSVNVTLYVTDEYGCKDTASNNFYIDYSPTVFIAGGFTPNGDGINDSFIIPSNGLKTCTMQIINRWGETVFISRNPVQLMNEGWDGTFNGKLAPEGSYTYLFRGQLESGKPVVYSGTVTIIR